MMAGFIMGAVVFLFGVITGGALVSNAKKRD